MTGIARKSAKSKTSFAGLADGGPDPCESDPRNPRDPRLSASIDLRPRVLQRDGAVEHRPARNGVGIDGEVPETLELKARAGRGVREAGLYLRTGQHVERVWIQIGPIVVGRAGVLAGEQSIVAAHLCIDRVRRRDPVERGFHLAAVGRVAAARGGIVRAAQLDDRAGGILYHSRARDEVRAAQPHLAPRAQAEELLRRILAEVVALD